jgi:hypothetical protein
LPTPPTAEQNQKKRSNHVLPKPDNFIRYRQTLAVVNFEFDEEFYLWKYVDVSEAGGTGTREAPRAQATASSAEALIARLRLEIERLRRTLYGVRSERKERLLDQLEMQLEDVEADAIESELAAERTATSTVVKCFERNRPARKPFPEHLPRERVVIAAPQSCPCCGSTKLSKLGEDVTETLEVVPRQWKVIQTVRRSGLPASRRQSNCGRRLGRNSLPLTTRRHRRCLASSRSPMSTAATRALHLSSPTL